MVDLVKINDEPITSEEVILHLKFNNELDYILDQMIRDRLLALGAEKAGIEAMPEELQERADQLRRVLGLHRAADVHAYLDRLQASVSDFQQFVAGLVIKNKMTQEITSDEKMEAYFRLHSPKFDTVTLGHIAVLEQGVANELVAMLEEEPSLLADLAREHSISDTAEDGGLLGTVRRGQVDPRVESRIFNAELRVPIGPVGEEDGPFDIFMVLEKNAATLDEPTRGEVRRAILDEWVTEAVKEVSIT
jgi:parvulin-like peptidyl-prolyl isomerase